MSHSSHARLRAVFDAGARGCVRLINVLLFVYRVAVSPLLGPCCRFAPTCSAYTREAIERYGIVRGAWLGLRRLLRCHPFHPGGWDPVV